MNPPKSTEGTSEHGVGRSIDPELLNNVQVFVVFSRPVLDLREKFIDERSVNGNRVTGFVQYTGSGFSDTRSL